MVLKGDKMKNLAVVALLCWLASISCADDKPSTLQFKVNGF